MNNCLHLKKKNLKIKKNISLWKNYQKKRATAKENFAKIYRPESSKEDDSNLLKKKILH
jgi:hypothetical protein